MTDKRPPELNPRFAPRRVVAVIVVAAVLYGAFQWQRGNGADTRAPLATAAPSTVNKSDLRDQSIQDVDAPTHLIDDVTQPEIDPDCAAHLAELDASPMSMDAINQHTLKIEEKFVEFALELEQSSDPLDRLIAVELAWGQPHAERIEKLEAIKAALPANPLVANALYEACKNLPRNDACVDGRAEKHLISIDGNNGATWWRIASRALERGDVDAGFDALTRVANATEHTTRTVDWIMLAERVLRMAPNIQYRDRLNFALGFGTNHAPLLYAPAGQACREHSAQSQPWHKLCLETGLALERNAKDLFANMFGIAYQVYIFESEGNQALADAALERKDALKRLQRQAYRWSAERRLFDDETALQPYFDAYRTGGEQTAIQHLVDTARAATADGHHKPCYDPRVLESISR